jgi:hypothetical protein
MGKYKVSIRQIRILVRLILVGFGYGSVDAKPKTDIIRRPIGRDWKAGEVCGFFFHGLRAGFAERKTSRNRHFC